MRKLIVLALAFVATGTAHAACNTRQGYVSDQPLPESPADGGDISATGDDGPGPTAGDPGAAQRYDQQTLRLDLSRDVTSLVHFAGRYTDQVPVLGIRMENLPGFDSARHCNIIQPIVYKPRIERQADGSIRASVENRRFAITFDPTTDRRAWVIDPDPSQRFFWIFPQRFGAQGLPSLTASYDRAFVGAAAGSDRRRWIAEAYIDIAMRYYRLRQLNTAFPVGWRPSQADLHASVAAAMGVNCQAQPEDLSCLASALIEINEVAPPGNLLARESFVVGDALLENSGVSTGVRQLDFGTGNVQAGQLAMQLFPSVAGLHHKGTVYRRPIRTWDIDLVNRWFSNDGLAANRDLSRDPQKRLLLTSHGTFLKDATVLWRGRIGQAYPAWNPDERKALALVAIDLETVSGYRLQLPPGATGLCAVLGDTLTAGGRSNHGVVAAQPRRMANARRILQAHLATAEMLDLRCLDVGTT